MADEAVLTAPAAAGGGSGADSGGAGAGTGGGTPAGGNGAPAAQPSDEEILGIDPVGAPEQEQAVPEAEQQPPAQPAADGKTPEQQAAEQIAEDGRLMPVKWREMAKQDPEFRTLFYTARANQEKLATMEPKFKEMETSLADVTRADQAYLSGDPTAIAAELKTFLGDKPDALLPMFEAGEQLLKAQNPAMYEKFVMDRTAAVLRDQNFERAFQVLRNAMDAGEKGLPVLQKQVEALLQWADGNGFPTTEKARVDAKARELEAREQSQRDADQRSYEQTNSKFVTDVRTSVEQGIRGEIKTTIDKMLAKSAFADGAKQRIAEDTYKEIVKILEAKQDIVDQVGKLIWPNGSKDKDGKPVRGIFNDQIKSTAINLPVSHAKTVLADVLKNVVATYTKDFMASQQTADKRMAAAASRTEVSGGAPAPRAPRKLTKKDTVGMSDEEILDA